MHTLPYKFEVWRAEGGKMQTDGGLQRNKCNTGERGGREREKGGGGEREREGGRGRERERQRESAAAVYSACQVM
jgi:hypothetical protein